VFFISCQFYLCDKSSMPAWPGHTKRCKYPSPYPFLHARPNHSIIARHSLSLLAPTASLSTKGSDVSRQQRIEQAPALPRTSALLDSLPPVHRLWLQSLPVIVREATRAKREKGHGERLYYGFGAGGTSDRP
jgi:hypothetical protein